MSHKMAKKIRTYPDFHFVAQTLKIQDTRVGMGTELSFDPAQEIGRIVRLYRLQETSSSVSTWSVSVCV